MSSQLTVGFIGFGIMGAPMAANLLKAGLDVTGYSRTRAKVDALVPQGIRTADDVDGAVRDADVIITMLPDSPDVEAVALGPGGILEHARSGALYIDTSSIRPDTARTIGARAEARGLRYLDAPVSGGEHAAIDGTLSIMVGVSPTWWPTRPPCSATSARPSCTSAPPVRAKRSRRPTN